DLELLDALAHGEARVSVGAGGEREGGEDEHEGLAAHRADDTELSPGDQGIGEKQMQLGSPAAHAPNEALVHCTLLQHGCVVEHAWPYCAHSAMSFDGVVPRSVGARSTPAMSVGGGGAGLVQVPLTEPGGTTQVSPLQQSALVVHRPPCITHMAPQCSAPFASGTHGSPLQQSVENEQLPPACTQLPTRLQRGMPTLSGLQQSLVEMHAQQSLRTLVVEPAHTGVGF